MNENIFVDTFTGKHINPLHIQPDDIDIMDIAHSLSLICRFGGHCCKFYSVGEHSLNVLKNGQVLHLSDSTCGFLLLHDAAEAYLYDLISPLKAVIPEYSKIENDVLACIYTKFVGGVPTEQQQNTIRIIDRLVLKSEYKLLMVGGGAGRFLDTSSFTISSCMTSSRVEREFARQSKRYLCIND